MIDKTIKLDLACGKDDLREVMQYVKVTREVMVATNAHILAVVPTADMFNDEFIQAIPEEGVLIHREDWKKMLQYEIATWKTEGEVIKLIHPKKRNLLIEVEKEEDISRFPNWEAVIPDAKDRVVELNQIRINFELGVELQKALGFENGRLSFSGQSRPIFVDSSKHEGRYGVIMPVMLS